MLCNAKENKKECSLFDRPHAGTRTIVLTGISCVCWAISDICAAISQDLMIENKKNIALALTKKLSQAELNAMGLKIRELCANARDVGFFNALSLVSRAAVAATLLYFVYRNVKCALCHHSPTEKTEEDNYEKFA